VVSGNYADPGFFRNLDSTSDVFTERQIMENQNEPQIPSSEDGLLYQTPAAKTDIRRTFREKCGWIGPEEQRRQAELQKENQ
jgi:hypothetical protein